MILSFEHNNQVIDFTVNYRKRKTLGIEVRPPGVVIVAVPLGTSQDRIISAVIGKADWIIRKREHLKTLSESVVIEEINKEGGVIQYLGKAMELKVVEDTAFDIPKVQVDGSKVIIQTASMNEVIIRNAIEKWKNQETKNLINQRIAYYQPYFKQMPSRVIIKAQKRRWGSCNSDRELRFNKECIRASERALDYLVVHEMCHMVHMNHSKDFWNHVEKIMPDYRTARAELKRILI